MKIRAARKPLSAVLRAAISVAIGQRGKPLLACFRLEVDSTTLHVEATDLQTTTRRRIGDVEVEQTGVTYAPAKALSKALDCLDDDIVELASDGNRLIVRAQARTIILACPSGDEWPSCANPDRGDPVVRANAETIGEALARASLCASSDNSRAVLTGVALQLEQGSQTMHVVASDSFRLGALTVELDDAALFSATLLVPAKAARAAAKQICKATGTAELRFHQDDGLLTITIESASWTIRLINGEFVNWRSILPSGKGAVATLDAAETASALKVAKAVRSEPNSPVHFSLGRRNALVLRERGGVSIREELPSARFSPDGVGEIDVAFNPDFVVDALRFIGDDRIELRLQDNVKPALFGDADRRYVLMPVRV